MKKAICLLSGGRDSAISALLAKKDYKIIFVHFYLHSPENAKKMVKKLGGGRMYLIDWEVFLDSIPTHLRKASCFLCRRMMYKVGEKIAEREGAVIIITGEDLRERGVEFLKKVDKCVKIPVLRPIMPFSERELEHIAEKNGIEEGERIQCPYKDMEMLAEKTAQKIERKTIDAEKLLEHAKIIEI